MPSLLTSQLNQLFSTWITSTLRNLFHRRSVKHSFGSETQPTLDLSVDLLAVPDFASGAMENWGLVSFREDRLIFDEKIGSSLQKYQMAETIAHEIAHFCTSPIHRFGLCSLVFPTSRRVWQLCHLRMVE